ncbi:sugar-binding protein [Lyngbya sp. CCY1209]|uniref:nSTAND1 domain-containing NTPase n=1 Tax=Lyngbya sp. CCY1209 TaxID=2886103 RepID=UPI002D21472B|nr:sugar-binding protein [Lyngbya sp. CCY1209]MEB3885206.1 AAA family ATPase [Lyngbya sp. CCY1209]
MDDRERTNRDALKTLIRSITRMQGDFSLILARCNYRCTRETIVKQLHEQCPIPVRELVLDTAVKTLYTTILNALEGEETRALMVFGLESVNHLEDVLKATNQMREEFRNFQFPLILWVSDRLMSMMIRSVPDFHSFATTVHFEVETDELIQFLQRTTAHVTEQLLNSGAAVFLDEATLQLESGSPLRTELEFAQQELKRRGVTLDPELEGNLELVLGRVADNTKIEALEHYQKSWHHWQRAGNPLGCGHVLFYLGFWWRYYAMMHRGEKWEACQNARNYYRECLEQLEAADRPDLVAKFINALGEVLLYLEEWDELEAIANRALDLHRQQSNAFREARAHHFLAEVELARNNWKPAGEIIQKALDMLREQFSQSHRFVSAEDVRRLDWEKSYHWGWYLLCLGRSQQGLGRHREATITLQKAKKKTKPAYDPELYIDILHRLHHSYFHLGKYLKAYHVKQHRREIEQQFRLRPFIGAGSLRESQFINNPGYPKREEEAIVNLEISASGRFDDIEKLVKRLGEDRHKLTVVYGQSGVGKSSLLQAGLLPKLKHKSTLIQTRRILPIYQKTYTHWIHGLSGAIASALEELDNCELDSGFLNTPEEILAQIREIVNSRNLMIALVFDQFEEFFVSHKEPKKRETFYRFLRDCLNTPYVKIVLSLRQDYLHHLLEGNRLKYFESVNDNILDKNILYYLGNFLPDDAKSVIQSLTDKTQFILDPKLIDRLVAELAGEAAEVRPIELQVVGSQLYAKDIKTLEKYEREGPNRRLVESYLEEVVEDCGSENKDLAELVLYLLTDEYNNRPLKTRYDLSRELTNWANYLNTESDNLDAVLKIFVQSGLVCLLPEIPEERYQLVHDYLVSFIREQRSSELVAKLDAEKRKREQAEAEIIKQRLVNMIGLCIGLGLLSIASLFLWQNTRFQERQTKLAKLNYEYFAFLQGESDQLKASITAIEAGNILRNYPKTEIERRTAGSLWEVENILRERDRLQGHSGSVLSVSCSPDGLRMVSGGQDGTIKLWNRDGQLEKSWRGDEGTIWSVAFNPNSDRDNQIVASAGQDGTIKLWKLDGTLIGILRGHTDEVKWVSFSPDSQQLASASRDGTVRLWSLNGKEIAILNGDETSILSVNFSPDGQLIASSDDKGTIRLWNRDGELIQKFKAHEEAIWSIDFSPDSQFLASASHDRTAKLWKRDGTLHQTLGGHEAAVNSISYSSDSRFIVTGSNDTTIKIWTYDGTLVSTMRGHNNIVNQVDFLPRSQMLVSASVDGSIRLWDRSNLPFVFKPNETIHNAVFSSQGQFIASVSSDNSAILWHLFLPNLKLRFNAHGDTVNNISVSPNGQLIASASADKTVKLWNSQGEVLKTLPHDSPVWTVSVSPNGQLIATATDDRIIRLWDRNGRLQRTIAEHTDPINDLSFSPDGRTIASVGDNAIKIWDIRGNLVRDLSRGGLIFSSVSFSPDGEILAVATGDGSLQLWKTSNWEGIEMTAIGRHKRGVYDLVFNSTGEILASASIDGTVKLWDRYGQLITTLEVGPQPVLSVDFSPDDKILVATDQDNRMVFWRLDYSHFNQVPYLLEQACGKLENYLKYNSRVVESDRNICDGIK